jgi:class 3 adenylate cyclase
LNAYSCCCGSTRGDLVGSTALPVRFDPEDLREIVGAYHRCVAETVGRFAAFVAKYMGDGVLVGYPQASGDDPERAVRVGLAVVDAVAPSAYRCRSRCGSASPAASSSSAT